MMRGCRVVQVPAVTQEGVIRLTHAGYPCPDPACVEHQQVSRSVQADALAFPHFTSGRDLGLLMGR